ncbi:MAG: recombinase family protein, partial [Faecalibacterium prausnitzii]|nr:recombinase family protein [Faecalibacterium prausnitzii]
DDRVVLNFNFTDDAKTVTREEVLGSSAVDNAPPHPQTIRSGDVVDGTEREPEQVKAGYHYGSGILPFAIFNSV